MEQTLEPARQHPTVRVLHSIERTGLTPVFGTSVPPSGLSGRLREFAFRYSEGDLRHWALLMLADRINVGEGLVSDLAKGRVPNLFAEMGLATEWRYNRAGFVRKALVLAAVGALTVWLMRKERREP